MEVLSPVPEGHDERILRDAPQPDPHRPCHSVPHGLRPRSPVTASLTHGTAPLHVHQARAHASTRKAFGAARCSFFFMPVRSHPAHDAAHDGRVTQFTRRNPFYAFSTLIYPAPPLRAGVRDRHSPRGYPLAAQDQQHVIAHTQPRNRSTPPRTQTQATQAYTKEAYTRTSTLFSFPQAPVWQAPACLPGKHLSGKQA